MAAREPKSANEMSSIQSWRRFIDLKPQNSVTETQAYKDKTVS